MGAFTETVVPPTAVQPTPPTLPSEPHVYGRAFWCTYIGNSALMIAFLMMYRYADFVLCLGGTEWTLGRIVGVGTIGGLAMRFFQGCGIDRFGPRRIWLWSVAGFVVSMLGHTMITTDDGPAIYVLRMLFTMS